MTNIWNPLLQNTLHVYDNIENGLGKCVKVCKTAEDHEIEQKINIYSPDKAIKIYFETEKSS